MPYLPPHIILPILDPRTVAEEEARKEKQLQQKGDSEREKRLKG